MASADPVASPESVRYSWLEGEAAAPLAERIAAPEGMRRLPAPDASFAGWLRGLPLLPGRPEVRLFDGRAKANQRAHLAVIDIDVGRRDLQQCADAVMRLRAEYLYGAGCGDAVSFRFTSGHPARWRDWRAGLRPNVLGNTVRFERTAAPAEDWPTFRRYLDSVFTYAGSASLARELERVRDPRRVEPGDVFIQGGFPGHAVLVVDVALGAEDERYMLLAQSYMPAQQIHVLRNPASSSPWYEARASGPLVTPEWRFDYTDLRRFPAPVDCDPAPPD